MAKPDRSDGSDDEPPPLRRRRHMDAEHAHGLRVRGLGWAEIASICGYASAASCRQAVKLHRQAALHALTMRARAEALETAVARWESLLRSTMAAIDDGDLRAIPQAIRIQVEIQKLLALHASAVMQAITAAPPEPPDDEPPDISMVVLRDD